MTEKTYTIKQLLGSEEAMKDLLHERLLAVRDDLNFAINARNNATAESVKNLANRVVALDQNVNMFIDQSRVIFRLIQASLVRIEEEKQRRQWKAWWKTLRKKCLNYFNR